MTASELFALGLERAGISRTAPEAYDLSCMLEEACGISRPMLPLRGEEPVSPAQEEAFFSLLSRWMQHEPLQYLLGKWEFYGLPFFVGPGVLIPRQDTETLAECAITFLKGRKDAVCADLCAGSGCLAATIAHYTGAKVYALELSSEALTYLRKNIAALHVAVEVREADVLLPQQLPPLDLIVSNPPYISRCEIASLEAQVRKEPDMALCGGDDGLHFYRVLPSLYRPTLKRDGVLMLEVGYNQAVHVADLMEEAGYKDIGIQKDLAGIERVVFGKKE